ncbi:MFS transporter [Streptomyces cyaneogriseus subsp. noncyanogenus]|uniref:MFS transporter n=1 Tax=Streptomyces cyaneogriseus subsp. noncyanogenus TaxID=477245 RepID=A0A0C5GD51_9ACTN|nr:MFS transporter [Streptomyces cyaneogriseus]AJP02181.1 MFS transporter [Streptomyces cyaneogriseus subsp. noncyanogenus]
MPDTGTDPTAAAPTTGGAPRTAAGPDGPGARPPHPGRTLAVTSAATAVALMIYTAPMVTLPATAAALGTAPSAQAWLLNGTPLGLAAALLVAGSLADDHGRRRVFVLGTLALGLTTLLSAFATTTWLFTGARIAQGVASAALLASSLGLLVHAFPTPSGRLRATGVWGACVSGGIAVGPLLTGAIPSWRWAYAVLGAAALLLAGLAARGLAESRSPRGGRPDLAGALAFGAALVALVAALTLGRDGWLRAPVGALLAAAASLLGAFALVERRAGTPMIDLGLLRRPRFLASSAGGLFTGLGVIGLFSYLPALLQQALGLTAMDTAWLFLVWSGLSFAVALQARRFAGRVPPRRQLVLGFALHTAGVLTMLGAVGAGSWTRLLPGLVAAGVGSGLLNAALPLLAVESVPAARAAMGSGAQQTFRYVGSCAGVALTIAVATSADGPGPGADLALWVSAGLGLAGAAAVLGLRERG